MLPDAGMDEVREMQLPQAFQVRFSWRALSFYIEETGPRHLKPDAKLFRFFPWQASMAHQVCLSLNAAYAFGWIRRDQGKDIP
jgi:hypothetical protein